MLSVENREAKHGRVAVVKGTHQCLLASSGTLQGWKSRFAHYPSRQANTKHEAMVLAVTIISIDASGVGAVGSQDS